jgi:nicotinamidase/pyrazinamidase
MMETRRALIVTDIQKDFCPGGSLAVKDGNIIVRIINNIIKQKDFYKIIATQDWHPQHHRSFASNYKKHEAFDIINTNDGIDVLWPDHCIAGTTGAEFHDDLITENFDLIIRKGTNPNLDSYSTFTENDKKTTTGLSGYLKEHLITEVFLCEIATDVCVFYSALDAVKAGFKTFVILDATAGVDLPEGNIDKTKNIMAEEGVIFISADELEF